MNCMQGVRNRILPRCCKGQHGSHWDGIGKGPPPPAGLQGGSAAPLASPEVPFWQAIFIGSGG